MASGARFTAYSTAISSLNLIERAAGFCAECLQLLFNVWQVTCIGLIAWSAKCWAQLCLQAMSGGAACGKTFRQQPLGLQRVPSQKL